MMPDSTQNNSDQTDSAESRSSDCVQAGADLKLDHQLCFLLYTASREIIRRYAPLLQPLGLTYTQYIVMLVLWEQDGLTVKEVGQRLLLDSGTLTPLFKRLETQDLIVRQRSLKDERQVHVFLTRQGQLLRNAAAAIPRQMACQLGMSGQDATDLFGLLKMFLNSGTSET